MTYGILEYSGNNCLESKEHFINKIYSICCEQLLSTQVYILMRVVDRHTALHGGCCELSPLNHFALDRTSHRILT